MSKGRVCAFLLLVVLVAAVPSHDVSTPRAATDATSSKRAIRFVKWEGGWHIAELFDHIHRTTGTSILWDGSSRGFERWTVQFTDDEVVVEDRLLDWLQKMMARWKMIVVSVGTERTGSKAQWFVMDEADPKLCGKTVYVAEEDIERYADRGDLYVVSTLTIPFTCDTTRMRNALSPLVTQEKGIGRLQDIPGSQRLIVGDYGPVVARMHSQIARLDAEFAVSDLVGQLTSALPLTTAPSGSSNVTPSTAPANR